MKGKIFIDTNILIYSLDNFNPEKKEMSRALIRDLIKNQTPVISTQIIQEFYVVATKKLDLDSLIIKQVINTFEQFEIVQINFEYIKDAIDISILNKLSFWDALVLTAAKSAKCSYLYSEDLNSGQIVKGIKIINPYEN
jgi:predicted nucleic acid-binding protein